MIEVESIEYSKNPASTSEAILIKVTAAEVLGTWNDLLSVTWGDAASGTWDDVYRKAI